MELAELQHQIDEQARKISALHEILESVSSPAELPIVLRKSLKAALIAAQGDAGFIHLRDKSGRSMRLVAYQQIPESIAARIGEISYEDGLVAWVARNRSPLFIADVEEDSRTVYLNTIEGLRAYIGAPISRVDRIWGTLSILGKNPAQFGPEEVRLLTSVGEEIGIVVENARLRRKAERLLVVQERNRLARELHDSVTQSLYSVTLFAEAGRRAAQADSNEELYDYLSQIGETSQQALKEMRLLIHRLRPSILANEGLIRALQQRLNSVEGRTGTSGRLMVEGEAMLNPAIEDALFQIAQEALNNALKHAMASEVVVRLNFKDEETVTLEVEDNGRGFDLDKAVQGDGMGLTSMRERAESFDGNLSVTTEPGLGCRVKALLRYLSSTQGQPLGVDLEELL